VISKALKSVPFLVVLAAISGVSMLVPMGHAVHVSDYVTARIFLESGALIVLTALILAMTTAHAHAARSQSGPLVALFAALVLLPVLLAFPLVFLLPQAGKFELYFEMLSCLTTTGASVFDASALSEQINLWRALVGWMGGFLMLTSAVAVMEPLGLGGFELLVPRSKRRQNTGGQMAAADTSERLMRFSARLAPVYLGITAALAAGLYLMGERALVAVIQAMSTISTSGISMTPDQPAPQSGIGGEALIFLFLMFAITRLLYDFKNGLPDFGAILRDPEFRLMLVLMTVLPLVLFIRHWAGAYASGTHAQANEAARALWAGIFTTLSFLTTTGFQSAEWHDVGLWSGLKTPVLYLLFLAVIGGGIATTAGGVRLLRVHALYRHGARELQKMAFPTSVGGAGVTARYMRRQGAEVAWLFFMVFVIAVALIILLLALTGLDFKTTLVFAVAALSTTGPLVTTALGDAVTFSSIGGAAQAVLAAAMVLGRLETIVIISLLNPEFWRR